MGARITAPQMSARYVSKASGGTSTGSIITSGTTAAPEQAGAARRGKAPWGQEGLGASYNGVVLITIHARLVEAQVRRVVAQRLVVGANVEADREHACRRNAATGYV